MTRDGLRLRGWYIPSRNGAAMISFPGRAASQKQAKMLARTATGCCSSTGEAKARAKAIRMSSAGRESGTSTRPSRSCRQRPDVDAGADRRDRPVRRRRDDDRGRGQSDRPQGNRLRGGEQPIRPRRSREPGNEWKAVIGNGVATVADGALHQQPAPADLRSLVPRDLRRRVLRLRRARATRSRRPPTRPSMPRLAGTGAMGGPWLRSHRRDRRCNRRSTSGASSASSTVCYCRPAPRHDRDLHRPPHRARN